MSVRSIKNVRYPIAKILEVQMGTKISKVHKKFFYEIGSGGGSEVISLNWDIAYDRSVTDDYGQSALDYGYG